MSGIYTSRAIRENHAIANGATERIELPVAAGTYLAIQLVWHDATSAFACTLETSNQDRQRVLGDTANGEQWSAEAGVTFVGAVGAAAGSSMKHLSSINSSRARLVITASANSRISIYVHGKA